MGHSGRGLVPKALFMLVGIRFIICCLGAPLARLEASVALGAVLDRLPNLRIVPGAVLEPIPSQIVYGVKRLPVLFGQ